MRPLFFILVFFVLTQLFGIFTGFVLLSKSEIYSEINELSVAPKELIPDPNSPLNAFVFLAYILLGAVFILLLSRFYKGFLLFKLLELSVISVASGIVFFALFLSFGLAFWDAIIFGSILGAMLGLLKFLHSGFQNAAAIISSAGVGALFGFSLGFVPILLLVVLLSLYDYIAVFRTKHMLSMAKELTSRDLSFSVTATSIPKRKKNEKLQSFISRAKEEAERIDLGTGDLSVPTMLSVSAMTLGPNPFAYAFAVAFGATFSVFLLLVVVSRMKIILPALPPICLGGLLLLFLVRLAGF
ncbi:MAG: presenilin family intramembrane aspartyl protease [Candidatus Micrarchaeota archaeon]|nr:presenilin family intramembrane aspartyl protease [Candidatus Micrarchaeota archaeon]